MKIKLFLLAGLLFGFWQAPSQELDAQVLMTVDAEPVYVEDFVRVYSKNLDLVQDESQKDIKQYLDLFVDYKLKIKEAEAQGLDTILKFKREFQTYRDQLARSYLTDTKVTEALVTEAYDRTINEVNASHILIRVNENAAPSDTLKAYNNIEKIRNQALAGTDFQLLARQYSEDPSAKENAGALGWFSALRMVYPFEDAAYNTPVGAISKPFRTRFGYHILKVNDKRKANGEVEVAHIMVAEKPKDPNFNAEVRIKELYQKVSQGEDFGILAKEFSDDKNSARDNGKLDRFGRGKLNSKVFEDKAFAIKKPGQISEPFKTQYGWHIVKLIAKYPVGSYEELRSTLVEQVTKDERANLISESLIKNLKSHYGFGDQKESITFFNTYITDAIFKGDWQITKDKALQKPLLSFKRDTITYREFAEYVNARQINRGVTGDKKTLINNWMNQFITREILQYHRTYLEEEDEGFGNIVAEYRDGLLIFDLMEKNIWDKARADTLGLQKFYEANIADYQYKKRVDVTIAKVNNKADARRVRKAMKKGLSEESIKANVNDEKDVTTLFTSGIFAVDDEVLPKNLNLNEGISKVIENDDYYSVVKVRSILPKGPKALKEVKGKVISDYQTFLEKQWLDTLRKKYPVRINNETLKRLEASFEKN